jgi:hypothetical protein
MTDYTITTNFGAKDDLPSGNAAKVIKGEEFTTEFTNIQTAIATKADTAGDTFTGAVNFSADVAVNTNTLFVDVSEAKVGIGTTSPSTTLDVHSSTNGHGLYIAQDNAGDNYHTRLTFQGSNGSGGFNTIAGLKAYQETNGTSGYLRFDTNGDTERMRIDSSGNVGIGTTNPDAKLVVQNPNGCVSKIVATDGGSAPSATAQLIMQGYEGRGAGIFIQDSKLSASSPNDRAWFMGTGYSTDNFGIGYAADGVDSHYSAQNMLMVDTSGNVLVGTTSLAVADQTGSTTGVRIADVGNIQAASQATAAYFNRLDSYGTIIELRKDGTAVGNIGTFDVGNGKSIFMSSDGKGLRVENYQGTGSVVPCNGSGTNLHNSINLGGGSVRFKNIYLVNNPNVSSDQRLKENIADADDAGSTIDAIQVRKFDWIEDGKHQSYGMIAQELAEVYPEAVNVPENSEDTLGIATGDLIPMLIKEVQSLRSRVAELESE